ncbi:Molybdate transport system substrate-binding protein [Paraburkholderia piptadeniae]|uniref:Molybdate transport system substrate-binding protein n=1 Tax=Paraburkholderia piptadeniae TaxID=1701573 RepID=A0A1N7SVM0_9BURK|nr:substrate-binding domain-containing protein [Paraburkholderia piptadeniae]SIT51516.1 Molybdate transport system substrate-binding protein [Paraburkholderia piptadeniae]
MDYAARTSVEVAGIASMATRQILARLATQFERDTGCRAAITSVGGVEAARRVQAGEAFDFVVLASDAIDRLAAEGCVDALSRVDIARSHVAIAVAAGAPLPDVRSEDAVRDAILRVGRIGYSTGPSGTHLKRLFARWGIADAIASRIVQAPPGVPVGTLIANGDVELGFQQLSELLHVPGIDIVGPLPPAIQIVTVFSAATCRAMREHQATARFLAFLASPRADDVKREYGMEPA